jgi:hypothetical protein
MQEVAEESAAFGGVYTASVSPTLGPFLLNEIFQ